MKRFTSNEEVFTETYAYFGEFKENYWTKYIKVTEHIEK